MPGPAGSRESRAATGIRLVCQDLLLPQSGIGVKYGEAAPIPAGRAWFGFKALRHFSDGNYGVLFFTFCGWSFKTDSKYCLSFMKAGFLIGNMRVSVGFHMDGVGEAKLPLSGPVCG